MTENESSNAAFDAVIHQLAQPMFDSEFSKQMLKMQENQKLMFAEIFGPIVKLQESQMKVWAETMAPYHEALKISSEVHSRLFNDVD